MSLPILLCFLCKLTVKTPKWRKDTVVTPFVTPNWTPGDEKGQFWRLLPNRVENHLVRKCAKVLFELVHNRTCRKVVIFVFSDTFRDFRHGCFLTEVLTWLRRVKQWHFGVFQCISMIIDKEPKSPLYTRVLGLVILMIKHRKVVFHDTFDTPTLQKNQPCPHMTTRKVTKLSEMPEITWKCTKLSEMSEIKQNGDTTQAKRSVSITGFVKTVFPTTGFDKTVLLKVVKRPKGSIWKKPGEPPVTTRTPRWVHGWRRQRQWVRWVVPG